MVTLPSATESVNCGLEGTAALQVPGHFEASSAGIDDPLSEPDEVPVEDLGEPPTPDDATLDEDLDRDPPLSSFALPPTGRAVSPVDSELVATLREPESPPDVTRARSEDVAAPPKTKGSESEVRFPPLPRATTSIPLLEHPTQLPQKHAIKELIAMAAIRRGESVDTWQPYHAITQLAAARVHRFPSSPVRG